MKIIEPGHIYELNALDVKPGEEPVVVRFVNREPGTEHGGTQTQEVLRMIIDRTMHCDNCLRWAGNDKIIYHLRMALALHEARAIERKAEKGYYAPERMEIGADGHFTLTDSNVCDTDAAIYEAKPKVNPLTSGEPAFCTRD